MRKYIIGYITIKNDKKEDFEIEIEGENIESVLQNFKNLGLTYLRITDINEVRYGK